MAALIRCSMFGIIRLGDFNLGASIGRAEPNAIMGLGFRVGKPTAKQPIKTRLSNGFEMLIHTTSWSDGAMRCPRMEMTKHSSLHQAGWFGQPDGSSMASVRLGI